MNWRRTARGDEGSAVVEFVLVLTVLMPLFLGIVQLALVLHVRNTAAAAAGEGARRAAVQGATPQDGLARTHDQLRDAISMRFVTDTRVETVQLEGMPAYRVVLDLEVPALGLGGPGVAFSVNGSAVLEPALTAGAGDPP